MYVVELFIYNNHVGCVSNSKAVDKFFSLGVLTFTKQLQTI